MRIAQHFGRFQLWLLPGARASRPVAARGAAQRVAARSGPAAPARRAWRPALPSPSPPRYKGA